MDWLTYFGISPPDMLAGFLGGIVNIFVFPKSGARAITGAVVFGVCVGNFAGIPFNELMKWLHPHGGAFVIGMLGPATVLLVIRRQFLGGLTPKVVPDE